MRNFKIAWLKKAKVVITRKDFEREYIGFSAAVEWIARADRELSGKKYIERIHETLWKLLDVLRNPVPGLTIKIEGIDC